MRLHQFESINYKMLFVVYTSHTLQNQKKDLRNLVEKSFKYIELIMLRRNIRIKHCFDLATFD